MIRHLILGKITWDHSLREVLTECASLCDLETSQMWRPRQTLSCCAKEKVVAGNRFHFYNFMQVGRKRVSG